MAKKDNDDFARAFGQALDAEMKARKVTQADLARTIGVNPSYVNRLVNGHVQASSEQVETLASALKLEKRKRGALHAAAAKAHGFRLDLLD